MSTGGHIRPRGPGAWELKYDLATIRSPASAGSDTGPCTGASATRSAGSATCSARSTGA